MQDELQHINGIKAFMLLVIFFAHAGIQMYHISQRACDYLFIISGYMIAYRHYDSSAKICTIDYVKRKLIKIYPLHFITCIYAALFIKEYNAFTISAKEGARQLGLNLLLLQSYSESAVYSFNSVAWFMSSLMGVYLIAPSVLKIMRNINSKWANVLLLILIWSIRAVGEMFNGVMYNVNPYHFPLFSMLSAVLGMFIYPLVVIGNRGGVSINTLILIGLFIIIGWLGYARYKNISVSIQILFVWLAAYIFALDSDLISCKIMRARCWSVIAKVQIEFYFFHQIVIRSLKMVGIESVVVILILSFFITLVLAYSYKKFLKDCMEYYMRLVLKVSRNS